MPLTVLHRKPRCSTVRAWSSVNSLVEKGSLSCADKKYAILARLLHPAPLVGAPMGSASPPRAARRRPLLSQGAGGRLQTPSSRRKSLCFKRLVYDEHAQRAHGSQDGAGCGTAGGRLHTDHGVHTDGDEGTRTREKPRSGCTSAPGRHVIGVSILSMS